MKRCICGVALALFFLPTLAGATPQEQDKPAIPAAKKDAPARTDPAAERDEYQLDGETEVLLNGLPSRYEDIPPNAIIQRMEVTREGVVVRVHFRRR